MKQYTNTCVCLLSLAVSATLITAGTKADTALLFSDFWHTQLLPNKNTVLLQTNSKINFLYIYYLAILVSVPFLIFTRKDNADQSSAQKIFSHRFRKQIIIFVSILIASQTLIHIQYFQKEFKKFFNKSTQQKVSYNFQKSYAFAQYCKSYLKGKHICQPITDINLDAQQNRLTYLAIQYYLYPLDIVTHRASKDFDCAIIFLKNDPKRHIPPHYKEMPSFDSKSLIAIKENIIP